MKSEDSEIDRSDVEAIAPEIGDSWHNQDVSEVFAQLLEAKKRYRAARDEVSMDRIILLWMAYDVYVLAAVKGKSELLRENLEAAGHHTKDGTHILTEIIPSIAGNNRDRANRWAIVLRFASALHVVPEKLAGFIQAHGGIGGCIDAYRAWKSPLVVHSSPPQSRKTKTSQRATTIRRRRNRRLVIRRPQKN